MTGMNLFGISQSVWNELAPSREVWVLLPNALASGILPQRSDFSGKIKEIREEKEFEEIQASDTSAADWTINQFLVPNFPETLEDRCLTLIEATLLYGKEPIQIEILHIDPSKIIAWGPGRLADDPSS